MEFESWNRPLRAALNRISTGWYLQMAYAARSGENLGAQDRRDRFENRFVGEQRVERPAPPDDPLKRFEGDRLGGVAQRALGIGMDFENKSVGSGRQSRQRHTLDQRPLAGSVRWIDHDWQMRELFGQRHCVEIEGEAS